MAAKSSVVGAFLGMGLAGVVLMTAIPALAQDSSTATGQQGTTGQQGQQPHKHSHIIICTRVATAGRSQTHNNTADRKKGQPILCATQVYCRTASMSFREYRPTTSARRFEITPLLLLCRSPATPGEILVKLG